MLWICVPLGSPLPLLMQAIEASSAQLGLLSAAWQVTMLAQIPAALFAQKLKRRKTLWATVCLAHRLLWIAPALIPILFPQQRKLWPILLIACLSLSNLFANLGTASWSSWMADIVPPATAGHFWSFRQRILSIGLIVGTALYGWILDRPQWQNSIIGFQWVFALCALFGMIDVLVHCLVHEPDQQTHDRPLGLSLALQAPFQVPGFLQVSLLMAAWTAAQSFVGYTLGMPGFFSIVHLRENFGVTYSQASVVFLAAAVGGFLFSGKLGSWMDRSGADAVFKRLVFWAPISMAAWWFAMPGFWQFGDIRVPTSIAWMGIAATAQGVFYGGTLLCQFRLTQMCTIPEGRTVAMAVHWSLAGIGGAIGALCGGWLKGWLQSTGYSVLPAHRYPFDHLVAIHLLLAWTVVLPLCGWFQRSIRKN